MITGVRRTMRAGAAASSRDGSVQAAAIVRNEAWVAQDGSGWVRTTTARGSTPNTTITREPPRSGTLDSPTPRFVAGLSGDAAALGSYLRSQVANRTPAERALLAAMTNLLITGYTPATVRSALVLNLARLPGMRCTRNVEDSLGRRAVAFSIDEPALDGTVHEALLFSPASGQFLELQTASDRVSDRVTVLSSSLTPTVPISVRQSP